MLDVDGPLRTFERFGIAAAQLARRGPSRDRAAKSNGRRSAVRDKAPRRCGCANVGFAELLASAAGNDDQVAFCIMHHDQIMSYFDEEALLLG